MKLIGRRKLNNAGVILCTSVTVVVALLFLGGQPSEAKVVALHDKTLSMTLIGDSYTAGNGAGNYYGDEGAYRSKNNWGHRYADWLQHNSVKVTVNDLAHSGYTTDLMKTKQLDRISPSTDIVLLTAGGNDGKFEEIVQHCFVLGVRSGKACEEKVAYARAQLPVVMDNTRELLDELQKKLRPDAQVVLVSYPLLSMESGYALRSCLVASQSGDCEVWRDYPAAKTIRALGTDATNEQAKMVADWNANNRLKVTFVDAVTTDFGSHEPNPSAATRNADRWINEFLETKGRINAYGRFTSDISTDLAEWYHPNIIGHQEIANAIVRQIGVPVSARPMTSESGDIDIAFVIDTTGSMGSTLSSIKQEARRIANEAEKRSGSARFAIVDFRDYPQFSGYEGDYPARVQLNFSSDIAQFEAGMLRLQLGGGGDWEESVYSGMMTALNLDWRPGVRKMMVVIGDAPAKDPEPITGYTSRAVVQKAYDVDPVEIYVMDIGDGSLSGSIDEAARQTGGIVFRDFSALADTILAAVDRSMTKPFGWIQGPYVVKAGESEELDARASYAVGGDIAKIEWDLDGDGVFEVASPDLLYTHHFTQEFGGTIGVRITDTNDLVGIGSTRLDVTDDGDTIPRDIDNCPDVENMSQSDYDNDGIGDACDADSGWPIEDMEGVSEVLMAEGSGALVRSSPVRLLDGTSSRRLLLSSSEPKRTPLVDVISGYSDPILPGINAPVNPDTGALSKSDDTPALLVILGILASLLMTGAGYLAYQTRQK